MDTELAAASLLRAGFGLTADDDEADLLFINTCAFLLDARKECVEELKFAAKWKKRKAWRKIIVGGCLVEWDRDFVFRKDFPQVDLWVNIDSVEQIGDLAARVWNGECPAGDFSKPSAKKYIYDDKSCRLQLTPSHYAYLKIADGCDNCCTYCMIPAIRGTLRSRSTDSVLREAENLIASGVRELILIAQDTSAFGREQNQGKSCLAELLDRLDSLEGDFRIRLMYLHPASVDQVLLDAMARCRHLIPCIEMPLQHIADSMLQKMHRKISEKDTRNLIDTLQNKMNFSVRTTFMLGFPGETQQDFERLCDFVRQSRFVRLGVFAFSPEKGTPAAELADQVPRRIAEARRDKIMEIQQQISLERNQALIGKTVEVILDEPPRRGKALGRTLLDAPEIDNTVIVSGAVKHRAGDFVKVRIKSAQEYELQGVVNQDETDR